MCRSEPLNLPHRRVLLYHTMGRLRLHQSGYLSINFVVLLLLYVLLLAYGPQCNGLDAAEIAALETLLSASPALAYVPHSVRLSLQSDPIPRNWTNDFSNVCSASDGFELYGVRCSGGHIDKIFWYAFNCPLIH